MTDIEDKAYKPSFSELSEYTGCAAFNELHRYMEEKYQALCSIEYSGDKVLLGWNAKYKKAGRTLCTGLSAAGPFPAAADRGPQGEGAGRGAAAGAVKRVSQGI